MSEMNIPSMSGQDVSQSLDWTMFTDARIVALYFFLNIFWITLDLGATKALANSDVEIVLKGFVPNMIYKLLSW